MGSVFVHKSVAVGLADCFHALATRSFCPSAIGQKSVYAFFHRAFGPVRVSGACERASLMTPACLSLCVFSIHVGAARQQTQLSKSTRKQSQRCEAAAAQRDVLVHRTGVPRHLTPRISLGGRAAALPGASPLKVPCII